MSGEWRSYVSVEEEELEDLRHKSQRADAIEAKNRRLERQSRQEQERNNRLERSMRQQEQRAQEHERRLTSLGQDMQNLAANLRSEMRSQRQEYLRLLDEQEQRMQSALQEQETRLQQNIDHLAQSLEQRWQRQEDIAEQWVQGLQEELAFIRETYRHEQFSPGEVAALESRLNAARQDIQNQMPQAAVSEAREAFRQAVNLGQRLELIEMTWNELYERAQEELQEALTLAEEYKVNTLCMETANGQEEIDLDVDYWTEGGWQQVRDGLQRFKVRLVQEKDTFQCEDLRRIIGEINHYNEILPQLEDQAKTALIASIKRMDIQTQICDALADLGYNLVDSTYAEEDFRRSYHLKMKNADNEEIVTVVQPQSSDQGVVNELQFHFYDQSPNDAIREERLQQVKASLQNEGMDMTPAKCVPEHQGANAAEEQRDFQQVRQPRHKAQS